MVEVIKWEIMNKEKMLKKMGAKKFVSEYSSLISKDLLIHRLKGKDEESLPQYLKSLKILLEPGDYKFIDKLYHFKSAS